MEIGIGKFCPGKMGFKPHWDWYLVTGNGKKMLKIKNGNGFCEVGFKKNELGNGAGTFPPPIQDPPFIVVIATCFSRLKGYSCLECM